MVRFIWEHPKLFKIHNIEAPAHFNYPELRLTVDYPQDMELAKEIYTHFDKIDFTTEELVKLYLSQTEMFEKVSGLVQISAPFIKS